MEILLFGITKEIAGNEKIRVSADENIQTVAGLRSWLATKYPDMKNLSSLAIAVDNEYAEDGQLLNPENEIALIPPVSGG